MSGAAPAAEAASFQNALFAADYDVVLSKLRGGAKVSKAIGTFLEDWALQEEQHGKGLVKASKRALGAGAAAEWCEPMQRAWRAFCLAQKSRGKQHIGFAICLKQSIARLALESYTQCTREREAAAQEGHELSAQMVSVRAAHDKRLRQYHAACAHADELVRALAPGAGAAAAEDSLLSKVWETLTPQSTLHERLSESLSAVLHYRRRYRAGVEKLNTTARFVRSALEANLAAQEASELRRAELVIEVLKRLFLAHRGMLEKLRALTETAARSIEAIGELEALGGAGGGEEGGGGSGGARQPGPRGSSRPERQPR